MRDTDMQYIPRLLVLSSLIYWVGTFNVDTDSPIVFKGPRNSYFGYSVAILENSQGTWLLVGAPRANDSLLSGVHQPGAVFQCNWRYRSSCQLVFIEDIGNEKQVIPKWKNVTVHHSKDNQWLGTSIDVNVHGDSQVMVCAPRWIDKKFDLQGVQLMNGLCYESNRDLHFSETSALPALGNRKKQVRAEGYYTYGMGSLGTSAAYSRDGKFSILGAPGINDWAGGFAYAEDDTKPRIIEVSAEKNSNSYFGMSVTTAKLSAEGVYMIIGGPRAGGTGKVYAYDSGFNLLLAKEGSQIGSSFGASVCAVDLNGDDIDDLVVGAPLFSEAKDEGRVYVYINKEFFNLELVQPLLLGSNAPGARFGTAIANVGDLNLDHYEDIAVGAPYEEEAGVVYIYNGAKSGLNPEPSQRIVGKSFGKDLKTFGWSFSRPWDIDGNHYEDFAVGAYESDKVVLFRTRPVFDLQASLESSPAIIDLNGEPNCIYRGQPWHCLEVSVCLRYTGQNLPPSAELNITLQLDTLERHRGERARLFLLSEGYTERESTNEIVTVRLDRVSCFKKYTVYTRKNRDVITPILMKLEYDIASNSLGIASMGIIEPIRNMYTPTAVHKQAMFALGCGEDHVCSPNLDIKTTPVFDKGHDYLMIDDSPSFSLEIVISNTEEISHLTVVTIDYPSFIYFSTVIVVEGTTDINCLPESDGSNTTAASLNCDIMTSVKSGDKVVLNARFYAYNIPYDVHQLELKTAVKSGARGKGTYPVEKESVLIIPVKMKTEMRFSGVSIPGQLAMVRELLTSHDDWSHLSHLYILRNLGPSPLPHGHLIVSVPSVEWFRLRNVQIETRGATDAFSHVPVECNLPADQNETHVNQTDYAKYKNKYMDGSFNFANCDSTVCFNVTCYVGFMHKYQTVYINVNFALRANVLQMLQVGQLKMVTSGLLREPDYKSYNSFTSGISVMTTTDIMFKVAPGQGVTWWLLIISISSGLLLLYILTVLLWKCGFFRRRKLERLQILYRSFDTEQEILHSNSLSADSGDIMIFPLSQNSGSPNHDSSSPGLFIYPHLEPDHQASVHNFHRHNFFYNHSLNRREMNQDFPQIQSFRTLQSSNRNHISKSYPSNSYRGNHHRNGVTSRNNTHDDNSQPNIWMASPPNSTPAPSFNNDMYLEPLESRA